MFTVEYINSLLFGNPISYTVRSLLFCVFNWRASEASETLSGVTQLKIGDICLYICGDVRMSFVL